MHVPHRLLAALGLFAISIVAGAQTSPLQVRGIAFDGLRNKPLKDARITLVGGSQTVTSDARGRFQFDGLAPGEYTFAMQHAALDSLGFTGLSTRASIKTGNEEVRIAVPTFATLWRAACGGSVPQNVGFVYGTIRDARTLQPVRNADVEVAWTDMILETKGRVKEVVQRISRSETKTDSTGSYSACGVPGAHWLRVHAKADTNESGALDLAPTNVPVQRRDMLVGYKSPSNPADFGTVAGFVTDHTGRVFPDARVMLDGVDEIRTGEDGRFTLKWVPPGTRQIEILSVGLVPISAVVDVPARDTATIAVSFTAPVNIAGVKVVAVRTGRALADEFDLRRKVGAGQTMDSTQVMKYQNLPTMFGSFPSLAVEYRRPYFTITMPNGAARCVPEVRLDGVEAGFGHIADLDPSEVAGVEVYNRAMIVPAQFSRAGHMPTCGMILVWTKYGFKNR